MTSRRQPDRPAPKAGRGGATPVPDRFPTGSQPDEQQQPAHDDQAEMALIGALLLDPTTVEHVATITTPETCYRPTNTLIWQTISTLHQTDTPTDPITVAHTLKQAGHLNRLPGGATYLHTCISACPDPSHAAHYAHIIANHHTTRTLTELATRLHHAAHTDSDHTRATIIADIRDQLDNTTVVAETDTWTPIDLGPALNGQVLTPPPCLLARDDGTFLLYMGRLHSISGEPEAGKTWLALIAVLQALEDRQHAIYLDFEDTPEGIVGRLLAMGAHPDTIGTYLHYIRPDRPIDDAARKHLRHLTANDLTTITVIDGVTEAMTLHGWDPYNNPDAAKFYEALPRYITRLPNPPAVVLIDHVPKDEDRPKRYAIGAQHKLAGLDGAAYMVDIVTPFAPHQPGLSRIRVAKDRPGGVRRNAQGGIIAELHIVGDDQTVHATLRPPANPTQTAPDGHWRPTILMERVSRYLETHPGVSGNDIEKVVRSRAQNVRAALEALVTEGYAKRADGPRRSHIYTSLETFRDSAQTLEPDND